MHARADVRGRRGFTLVETLLALALTAVVLGAAWRAVTRAAEARADAVARARATADVRGALRALADDVARAEPDGLVAAPPPAAPLLRWREAEPVPRVVTLALEGDVLMRRERTPFAPPDAPPPAAVPVLRDVRALAVRGFDGVRWTTGWKAARLPRALELGIERTDGSRWTTRVAPLLADAPAAGGAGS
jgi:prepilin-type N-terminal cleavage/methylation domain-containing protein